MSTLDAISSLEEQRAQIDERISRLQRKIHDLHSRRNALAPISRLPPELMLETFRMCRDDAVSNRKLHRWIAEVTHVCQRWREIALPACSLWSTPDFSRPDSMAEMLRRSGGGPLDMILDYEWDEDAEDLDSIQNGVELAASTLASNINRVRSIHLNIPESCLAYLLERIAGPALALESLTIHNNDSYRCLDLPAEIFSGEMPNLRNLSLDTYYVNPVAHHSCSNLARLFLENTTLPSIKYLHTILQSMPQLEELILISSLPHVPAEGYNPTAVTLSNLHTLSAEDTLPSLAAFLAPLQCTFPAAGMASAVTIRCTDTHPSSSIAAVTKISRWASSSLAAPFKSLHINGHYPLRVCAAPASLQFEVASGPSDWPLLEAFILAFHGTESITAAGSKTMTWGAILGRVQGLRMLELDRWCADDALRELARRERSRPASRAFRAPQAAPAARRAHALALDGEPTAGGRREGKGEAVVP